MAKPMPRSRKIPRGAFAAAERIKIHAKAAGMPAGNRSDRCESSAVTLRLCSRSVLSTLRSPVCERFLFTTTAPWVRASHNGAVQGRALTGDPASILYAALHAKQKTREFVWDVQASRRRAQARTRVHLFKKERCFKSFNQKNCGTLSGRVSFDANACIDTRRRLIWL